MPDNLVLESIPRGNIPAHIPDPDDLLTELHGLLRDADSEDKPRLANAIANLLSISKEQGPGRAVQKLCQAVPAEKGFVDHEAERHRIKKLFSQG